MDKIISCEFNIDTACVEVNYADGSMISIDCTRVENEVARNMYEASEFDWLLYTRSGGFTLLQILIAEDDRELQLLFSHVLTKHGYTVTGVSNGQQALDTMGTDYFDMIIFDIQRGIRFMRIPLFQQLLN